MGGVLCVLDKWVAGILGSFAVAPCAGAGIEICALCYNEDIAHVAPCAGAGIEIRQESKPIKGTAVAPCAGAGIEIC